MLDVGERVTVHLNTVPRGKRLYGRLGRRYDGEGPVTLDRGDQRIIVPASQVLFVETRQIRQD